MKKVYSKVAALTFLIIGFGAWFTAGSHADSTGHGKGVGSPDEVTCSQSGCHGAGNGNGVTGLPDNAGPGNIALTCSNMPGWIYTLGTVYHMTVTITQSTGAIFGFSAVALDEGLAQAGTQTVTDNTHSHTAGSFPINKQYITHTGLASASPGTAMYTNPAVFIFDWTAPATNKGPLTYFFDGIAGNNNQKEDGGDNVYKGSQVMTPNTVLSTPTVFSDVTAFTLRTTAGVAGPGMPFYVGGHALTGNITVAIPSPFEVSLNPGSGYSGSLTLTQSAGNVMATRIWVRYNASLAGSSPQTLTISSAGATNKTANMTGQVGTPSIGTPNPSLITTFTTTVGTPSSVDSFIVTTSGLVDTLFMVASPNFELSHVATRSFVTSEFTNAFPPFYGFTNQKIYVRYNPASAGTHTGTITITSTGGSTKTVTLNGISTSTAGIPQYIGLTDKDMKVFPNPAKDVTRLAFNISSSKQLEFRIIDLTGKQYFTTGKKLYQKGDNEVTFSTDALSAGLYFISTEDDGKRIHKSFVKE